jgi:hypothetical protein
MRRRPVSTVPDTGVRRISGIRSCPPERVGAVAVITEEPSIFRLEHDGEFAGFVALRRTRYTYRQRRGLRRIEWSTDELESNIFLPSEGLPTGFGVSTEMAAEVACDGIHYRGIAYALVPLTGRARDEAWQHYFSDDPS